MVRSEGAEYQRYGAKVQTQAECTAAVSTPQAQVAAHQQNGQGGDQQAQACTEDITGTVSTGGERNWLQALRPRPRSDDLEIHRATAGRGRFDADPDLGPIRVDALPRRPRVGVPGRYPRRSDRGELRDRQAGLSEDGRPVWRARIALRLIELRRGSRQAGQSTRRIHQDGYHARHGGRGLLTRDHSNRFNSRSDGDERAGALAIPERERGRRACP
jgi:hypothetical protein